MVFIHIMALFKAYCVSMQCGSCSGVQGVCHAPLQMAQDQSRKNYFWCRKNYIGHRKNYV